MTIYNGEDNTKIIYLSDSDYIDSKTDNNFVRIATIERTAVDQIHDFVIEKVNNLIVNDLFGEKEIELSWKKYDISRSDNSIYYITFYT